MDNERGFFETLRRRMECWFKGFHFYGAPPFPRVVALPRRYLPVRCANCGKLASQDELTCIEGPYWDRMEIFRGLEYTGGGGERLKYRNRAD